MKTLQDIVEEMESLERGDPEYSHSRADERLLETIEILNTSRLPEIDRIIQAFREMEKWYA